MIRPTPSSTARSSSAIVLLLPWKPTRSIGKPARSATASSPPEHTSRLSPSSCDPAGDRRAQERLAGVVDVAAREAVAEGAGPGAEVGLVQDVRRRPVLGRPGRSAGRRRPRGRRRPCCAVRDHSSGTSALTSPGSRSHAGPRTETAACAQPASCARIGSHPLRGGDAEQARARWPARSRGRVDEQQPGPVEVGATGSSPSGSTRQWCRRTGEGRGVLLEVARHPVRLAQLGRAATTRGNSASARSSSPSRSWVSSVGVESSGARCPGRRRCAGSGRCGRGRTARRRRGCRWAPWSSRSTSRIERRVGGVAGQGVAQRVDPDQRRPAPASVTIVPARLDSRSSWPSCMILTSWPISTSRLYVRVVAAQARHRLQPPDVAVVVGAEQVDADVEARAPACRGSRRVAGEVGAARRRTGSSTRSLSSPASVGPHPQRAVLLEQVPLARAAARCSPGPRRSRAATRSENHTSKWVPKCSSCSCCSRELERVRRPPGRRPPAPRLGQVEDRRVVRDHLPREVVDVGRRGSRPRARAGPVRAASERGAEQVHLAAAVVDVELPGHLGAGRGQHPRERVTDGGPPRVRRGAGGPVGLAEMNSTLILCPASVSLWPYAAPAATTSAATWPCAPAATVMLRKPGPATSTARCRRPRAAARPAARPAHAGSVPAFLRQLERHVGGVVAVTLLPRTLHRHLARDAVGQGEPHRPRRAR